MAKINVISHNTECALFIRELEGYTIFLLLNIFAQGLGEISKSSLYLSINFINIIQTKRA
jgi:hypothetical protein